MGARQRRLDGVVRDLFITFLRKTPSARNQSQRREMKLRAHFLEHPAGVCFPPNVVSLGLSALPFINETDAKVAKLPVHFWLRLGAILEDHIFRPVDLAKPQRVAPEVDVPGAMASMVDFL